MKNSAPPPPPLPAPDEPALAPGQAPLRAGGQDRFGHDGGEFILAANPLPAHRMALPHVSVIGGGQAAVELLNAVTCGFMSAWTDQRRGSAANRRRSSMVDRWQPAPSIRQWAVAGPPPRVPTTTPVTATSFMSRWTEAGAGSRREPVESRLVLYTAPIDRHSDWAMTLFFGEPGD